MLAERGSKKLFSKFDLVKGYWPMLLTEDSKDKTAFSATSGGYRFKYMTFSIKTAPRLVRMVLDGIPNVHHYIDDIIVAPDTWEQHVTTLKMVLGRVKEAGLTIKPKNGK